MQLGTVFIFLCTVFLCTYRDALAQVPPTPEIVPGSTTFTCSLDVRLRFPEVPLEGVYIAIEREGLDTLIFIGYGKEPGVAVTLRASATVYAYTRTLELSIERPPVYHYSDTVKATYTRKLLKPTIIPASGVYGSPLSVAIMAEEDVTILYTVDGTDPLQNGQVYRETFQLGGDKTVIAVATHWSTQPSEAAQNFFTLQSIVVKGRTLAAAAVFRERVSRSQSDLLGRTFGTGISAGAAGGGRLQQKRGVRICLR